MLTILFCVIVYLYAGWVTTKLMCSILGNPGIVGCILCSIVWPIMLPVALIHKIADSHNLDNLSKKIFGDKKR